MNEQKLIAQLQLPSAWQQLKTSWTDNARIELWIKRDDLIHPLISGNKWRKLKGILFSFQGYTELVTYGGAYSNHLIACAVTADLLQLPITAFVRGEKAAKTSTVLELCSYYGMEIRYLNRSDYKEKKHLSGLVGNTLHIPEGGGMPEGTLACKDIIEEDLKTLDHLYLAAGTGTTSAGILASNALEQTRVHVISVLKGGEFIKDEIEKLGISKDFDLITDHHRGGYAKTDLELMQFICDFYKETKVLLDPIYTAKAMYALYQDVLEGAFPERERIGFIHTGGLTGWYGKWTELLQINPDLKKEA